MIAKLIIELFEKLNKIEKKILIATGLNLNQLILWQIKEKTVVIILH